MLKFYAYTYLHYDKEGKKREYTRGRAMKKPSSKGCYIVQKDLPRLNLEFENNLF